MPALGGLYAGLDDMPPVFATGLMVAFVEWTCMQALRPFLAPGQQTVGSFLEISHVAATPVGMEATAEVELVGIEGRKLRFRIACRDSAGPIGDGFHERFLIDAARFDQGLASKAAAWRATGASQP